jgi:hypothetical protein
MIDFEKKTITILKDANFNGHQIYHMVDSEIAKHVVDGKLPEGKEHPYELQTVKLGERTGLEPISVGLSTILMQRVQLRAGWHIIQEDAK